MNDLSNNTQYPTILHHPHVSEFLQYTCKILNEKHYSRFPDPHLQVRVHLHSINVNGNIIYNKIQRYFKEY